MLITVAQMNKHIDSVRQIGDVTADLNYSLAMAKDKFNDSVRLYHERDLSQVKEAMSLVAYRVDALSKKKQRDTFQDSEFSYAILDDIRQEKNRRA